jgi:hypothetical protein
MENADYYLAKEYLKLGLYLQTFELFMPLESGSFGPSNLEPCLMDLVNQLQPSQLGILFDDLEWQYEHKNSKAVYNFGLVNAHVGDTPKTTELLQTAMRFGVLEAIGVH